MDFSDQVFVVTGAASGIGLAIARKAAAAGARVIAVDLPGAMADGWEGIEGDVVGVEGDITDPATVVRVIELADGRISVLCNNAGIFDGFRLVDELSLEQWNRVLAVNLTAPFMFCSAIVPLMVEHGGGVILNMSSINGLRGARAGVGYAATKAGLIGLTKNIAGTFRDDGIRAVSILPGGVRFGAKAGRVPGFGESDRGRARILPHKDEDVVLASPDHIADVAMFLAGPGAAHISGTEIVVDLATTTL